MGVKEVVAFGRGKPGFPEVLEGDKRCRAGASGGKLTGNEKG